MKMAVNLFTQFAKNQTKIQNQTKLLQPCVKNEKKKKDKAH